MPGTKGIKLFKVFSKFPFITHKGIFNRGPFFFFLFSLSRRVEKSRLTCNITTPLDNSTLKKLAI